MKSKILVLLFSLSLISCGMLYNKLGGDFHSAPEQMDEKLSPDAKKLLEDAFADIDKSKLVDMHLHLVGLGKGGTGVWINPMMSKWYRLGKFNRFNVYLSASGVTDQERADQQYVERLVALHETLRPHFKSHLFAFDHHYNEDGTKNLHHSEFYVPNDYVWKVYIENKKHFVPVISLHPYRKDALRKLSFWAKKGVKFVKWLPNAQGIDPLHEKSHAFLKLMKKYNMTLITHTGEERAVESDAFQKLGNPLRLRPALDMGLNVIMAHMASLGPCTDYENGNKVESCFDLFWKLFSDKKYEKNLYADLSGALIYTRIGRPMDTILENPHLQHKIVYGSDYPLPAINFLYRTSQLKKLGYITAREKELIDEIYDYNPLVFHFVLLRNVKHPKTGKKLSPKAFEAPASML